MRQPRPIGIAEALGRLPSRMPRRSRSSTRPMRSDHPPALGGPIPRKRTGSGRDLDLDSLRTTDRATAAFLRHTRMCECFARDDDGDRPQVLAWPPPSAIVILPRPSQVTQRKANVIATPIGTAETRSPGLLHCELFRLAFQRGDELLWPRPFEDGTEFRAFDLRPARCALTIPRHWEARYPGSELAAAGIWTWTASAPPIVPPGEAPRGGLAWSWWSDGFAGLG